MEVTGPSEYVATVLKVTPPSVLRLMAPPGQAPPAVKIVERWAGFTVILPELMHPFASFPSVLQLTPPSLLFSRLPLLMRYSTLLAVGSAAS